MKAIAPEVWSRLSNERIQGETLWARRAAPDLTERLVAALDADGKRHLLIPLSSAENEVNDSQSRGIEVATRALVMRNQQPGRYLDITCQDVTGHQAFDLIAGELAERLANNTETATEIVTRVISKWRRFWGQAPKQLLTKPQQIGLFAEVWFLSYWLIPQHGPAESVRRWRGPFGSRHDFEWNDCSVEVKATTSTRGCIHRINGLDQLTPPDTGNLFCFSLQLREEAGANDSLPSVIAACQAQIAGDPDSMDIFENALLRAEYSHLHEDDYSKLKFRVVTQGLYTICNDFPRLTRVDFPNGLPKGIEHIEYDINLSYVPHLCVANLPAKTNIL